MPSTHRFKLQRPGQTTGLMFQRLIKAVARRGFPSAFYLLLVWWAGGLPRAGAEGVLKYTVADWPVAGLGNARVRLAVSNKAAMVWAHVPWRRRDANPEKK